MGWLFMSSLGGHATPNAYLDAQFTFENEEGKSEVLASSMVNMTTWYGACRQTNHKTGDTTTFAGVCLVKYNKRASDGMIFGYKDLSENMGPCEDHCPAKILDLLDPTTHEYALDWRKRCRANLARRARKLPKGGDVIIFANDIRFTDGSVGRRFLFEQQNRRVTFTNCANGLRYRISRWKDRDWSLVPRIEVKDVAA